MPALILSNCATTDKEKSEHYSTAINLSTSGDDIAFDKEAVQVPFVKHIVLTFRNEATTYSEIYHNVAIVKPGFEKKVLKEMDKMDYELDHKIDSFTMKKLDHYFLAKSTVIDPQQEITVDFRPPKPGIYMYVCLVPGHGTALKMRGYLNVKKKEINKEGVKK